MIKLLILDVDGTMTNGKITYTNSNEELKSFCVKDGLAIVTWQKMGNYVALITGRKSKIVANRANELKIKFLHQNCKDKVQKVEDILEELNITWDNVASIGDDLNDYNMLKNSKLSYTPCNGSKLLNSVENIHRLNSIGGDAAVREMIEDIITREDRLEEFVNIWVAK